MWQIGEWTVDSNVDTISNSAATQKLERRAMEVLLFLAESAGKVVTKDDLISGVWGRAVVSDHAIAMVVSQLRKALGDDARTPRYIETITKRGYRLVCSARRIADTGELVPTAKPAAVPAPKPQSWLTPRAAIVAFAALATIGTALILLPSPSPTIPVAIGRPQLVVADFVNTTGAQQFDHIAYAFSIHLAMALQPGETHPVVRWRDDGLIGLEEAKKILGRQNLTLVTGAMSRIADQMALRVQIREIGQAGTIWTRDYPIDDRSVDSLALQVARDVALASGRALTDTVPGRPFPPEVHDLFWRAYYARNLGGKDARRQSYEILKTLVEKHPDYVPGRQLMAFTLAETASTALGLTAEDALAAARSHLAASKQAQGGVTGWTAFTEAWLSLYAERNLRAAVDHAKHATKLNANSAMAWQTLAQLASLAGEHDLALTALNRARQLDLANLSIISDRTWALYAAGRFEEAAEWHSAHEQLDCTDHVTLALISKARSRDREALDHWIAYLRAKGADSNELDKIETSAAPATERYAHLARAAEPIADAVGTPPLAMLRMLAGDRQGTIRLLQSITNLRDSRWNTRLHQIHLFSPLKDEEPLRHVFLAGGPGDRRAADALEATLPVH